MFKKISYLFLLMAPILSYSEDMREISAEDFVNLFIHNTQKLNDLDNSGDVYAFTNQKEIMVSENVWCKVIVKDKHIILIDGNGDGDIVLMQSSKKLAPSEEKQTSECLEKFPKNEDMVYIPGMPTPSLELYLYDEKEKNRFFVNGKGQIDYFPDSSLDINVKVIDSTPLVDLSFPFPFSHLGMDPFNNMESNGGNIIKDHSLNKEELERLFRRIKELKIYTYIWNLKEYLPLELSFGEYLNRKKGF
jgi:hypothetical protein